MLFYVIDTVTGIINMITTKYLVHCLATLLVLVLGLTIVALALNQ